MFSLIQGFLQYLFAKPKVNILLIGLDHAGKTTLLERIKTQFGNMPGIPPDKIPPTIGMNLAKINYKGTQVIIWDLGGQIKMRNIWEKYYETAHAIIFMVDSVDIGRLEEAKLAYEAICDHDQVSGGISVLIVANKQDVEGALSPADLAINFYSMQDNTERSRVFPICALNGDGVDLAVAAAVELAKLHARSLEDF
mmetsp:Transcript_25663/g.44129  ORF Transcript_25663/g.44129 Transcript_25663/m.44129 type:complete len:196 (-) Transcript_25663:153-740(-)